MSYHEWWMVGVAVAGVALFVVLAVLVPRGEDRVRKAVEDDMVRTVGRSVQLVRSERGGVYEMIEFQDSSGRKVVGRPAPPSRTITGRQGREVTVRYRADDPRFFLAEPLA